MVLFVTKVSVARTLLLGILLALLFRNAQFQSSFFKLKKLFVAINCANGCSRIRSLIFRFGKQQRRRRLFPNFDFKNVNGMGVCVFFLKNNIVASLTGTIISVVWMASFKKSSRFQHFIKASLIQCLESFTQIGCCAMGNRFFKIFFWTFLTFAYLMQWHWWHFSSTTIVFSTSLCRRTTCASWKRIGEPASTDTRFLLVLFASARSAAL